MAIIGAAAHIYTTRKQEIQPRYYIATALTANRDIIPLFRANVWICTFAKQKHSDGPVLTSRICNHLQTEYVQCINKVRSVGNITDKTEVHVTTASEINK